jgi:hypothetical protein
MSEADDDDVSSAANAGFTTPRQLVVDAGRRVLIFLQSNLTNEALEHGRNNV